MEKKALEIFSQNERATTKCLICPIGCLLKDGNIGQCGARKNVAGDIYSMHYGEVSGIAIDPIEKKPFYHFHPTSTIFSVGGIGCNLLCPFCQNYNISQINNNKIQTNYIPKENLIKLVLDEKEKNKNMIGIAFTYNEPIVNFEYLYDCLKLAKENDIITAVVTNGYINKEPLKMILPYIDAINIDIKGDNFAYKNTIKAKDNALEVILENVAIANKYCHVEITTLIVAKLCDWKIVVDNIASSIKNINEDIAYHISQYHPAYNYTEKSMPLTYLDEIYSIAKKHLSYVYRGNIHV